MSHGSVGPLQGPPAVDEPRRNSFPSLPETQAGRNLEGVGHLERAVEVSGVLVARLLGALRLEVADRAQVEVHVTLSLRKLPVVRIQCRNQRGQADREHGHEVERIVEVVGAGDEVERAVEVRNEAELLLCRPPRGVARRSNSVRNRLTRVRARQPLLYSRYPVIDLTQRNVERLVQVDTLGVHLVPLVHVDVLVVRDQRAEDVLLSASLMPGNPSSGNRSVSKLSLTPGGCPSGP